MLDNQSFVVSKPKVKIIIYLYFPAENIICIKTLGSFFVYKGCYRKKKMYVFCSGQNSVKISGQKFSS